jgi:heptosyltransferase I
MKKFLIVKTSSLGDIIQTFPSLSYLRRKFPYAQIDWVVEKSFAELILTHPDVNNVHLIDSKTWRKGVFSHWKEVLQFRKELQKITYDAVFDLQGNVKSGFITSLVRSPSKVGFGWKTVHEKPNTLFTNKRYNPPQGVNIREDYLLVVKGFFADQAEFIDQRTLLRISPDQEKEMEQILSKPELSQGPKVMVCPGSAWSNKQLTKESLVDFLTRLQGYLACSFVFVWGSQAEQLLVQELHVKLPQSILLNRLSLPILQNLMDQMDLVVAMDSLPLHLAGTTKTKTFSVFGASLASKFKPAGGHHHALQGTCPYGRQFDKRCPILRTCPTGACIRSLSGETVFESFQRQWNL